MDEFTLNTVINKDGNNKQLIMELKKIKLKLVVNLKMIQQM